MIKNISASAKNQLNKVGNLFFNSQDNNKFYTNQLINQQTRNQLFSLWLAAQTMTGVETQKSRRSRNRLFRILKRNNINY